MAHGQHVMRGFATPLSVCMQVHWHIAGAGEQIDNGIFRIRTIVIIHWDICVCCAVQVLPL